MKSLAKALMLILLLFNTGVLISSADSPPPLPNTFSGTVKFANSSGQFDVPAGTVIEALIENVTKGSTTVIEAGKYQMDVSGTYDDDGKNIAFIVNNLTAEQRAVFNASSPPPVTLNLIVNLHGQTSPTPKQKVPRKPIAGKLEVIIIPENPTIYDNVSMEVKLTYPTAGYKEKFGNASIKNNTITVNIDSEEPKGMAAQVITTYSKKYNLGYLSEGAYTCEVYINGALAEAYRFVATITASQPTPAPASGGGGGV
ncbi:MAG: hypothetical protein L6265_08050 [Thermoplasmatales archaeon]|nr:hypothetical protein [Thermoplasmatales archaeon]